MIPNKHTKTFQTDGGLLKFVIRETTETEFSLINISIYFKKTENKSFAKIGDANFNVYIEYGNIFEHIVYCDLSNWELLFVSEIYDSDTDWLKPEYDKGVFQDLNSYFYPFFSLSNIEIKGKYKGLGVLKKVVDTMQELYHVGVIMAKPMPLQEYDRTLPAFDEVYNRDFQKLCKHYESVGFEFLHAEETYCFYWLKDGLITNFYEQGQDFFKKNTILWQHYNTDFVQDYIGDEVIDEK